MPRYRRNEPIRISGPINEPIRISGPISGFYFWRVLDPRSGLRVLSHGFAKSKEKAYKKALKVMAKVRGNPIAIYNPKKSVDTPNGILIYGRCLYIVCRKIQDTRFKRGLPFRHNFSKASQVRVIGLPNGDVLLKSATGQKLHTFGQDV